MKMTCGCDAGKDESGKVFGRKATVPEAGNPANRAYCPEHGDVWLVPVKYTRGVDVYLDSGVHVTVPPDLDVDSEEGINFLKAAAQDKLVALVQSGNFDITVEELVHD